LSASHRAPQEQNIYIPPLRGLCEFHKRFATNIPPLRGFLPTRQPIGFGAKNYQIFFHKFILFIRQV